MAVFCLCIFRGIFIVTKLSQISKWKSDSRWEKTREDGPETYVVQRYVTNPYLVAGRKFDMRLYVLVTSYMPMTVNVHYKCQIVAVAKSEFAAVPHTKEYISIDGCSCTLR